METGQTMADPLACARCGGPLAEAEGGLRCGRCLTSFPRVGSIPCLLDDPGLWRTVWLRRLDDYSQGVEMRISALRQEAEAPDLLPRTQQRLLRIAAGFEVQLAAVDALFEPLERDADLLPSMAIPSRPEPGSQAAVLECYEHLFRDWVWGQREHEVALGVLQAALPRGVAGQVAVYGAGAGRLAADFHQTFGPARTFALDVNPLPFLVVDRVLGGETVTLPEFPVDPASDGEVVILRELARPFVPRQGLSFVFADALRPPFRPGSLDAVVTSWFIDVAPADLRQTAAAINRVLRPGGLWVNLGPLRFRSTLARSYSIEETHEIVERAAFNLLSRDRQDVPYFHSPVSGSRRTETVFQFVAEKTGDVAPVEIPDPLPPWVANPLLPVPITPALVALGKTSMFTTGVLSLIDGTRSIADVAQALGAAWGVEPGRLHDELRAFLARLPAS
jgi:N2227-like protein